MNEYLWTLRLFSFEVYILCSLHIMASLGQNEAVTGIFWPVLMNIPNVHDADI